MCVWDPVYGVDGPHPYGNTLNLFVINWAVLKIDLFVLFLVLQVSGACTCPTSTWRKPSLGWARTTVSSKSCSTRIPDTWSEVSHQWLKLTLTVTFDVCDLMYCKAMGLIAGLLLPVSMSMRLACTTFLCLFQHSFLGVPLDIDFLVWLQCEWFECSDEVTRARVSF